MTFIKKTLAQNIWPIFLTSVTLIFYLGFTYSKVNSDHGFIISKTSAIEETQKTFATKEDLKTIIKRIDKLDEKIFGVPR